MNKKLLFGIMSLAALAACTNDDFDSQQQIAEGTSPIQFEVINNNASMRASMGGSTGDKVVWSAADGDLFTLYHGGTCAADGDPLTAYQNATYKAVTDANGQAVLTTPSMINPGYAIMTWPTDTVFRANGAALSIVIPQNQTAEIQNEIPYVSDLINIQAYQPYTETAPATAYNTAGKDRKYSVYMRPMASQLNLKAEYGTTEDQIATLYEGATGVETGEGIDPIEVTSVELLTTPGAGGTTPFTTEIPLKFTTAATYVPAVEALPTAGIAGMWNTADANNAWSHVTCFDVANIAAGGKVDKLTTEYLTGNSGAKFLILPQVAIAGGVADPGVVVNTIYGKVVIANPTGANPHATKYSAAEYNNAWYRYLSTRKTVADAEENVSATAAETSGENAGKYKTVAVNLAMGMQQTINYMSTYEAKASLPAIQSEPLGVALTRYVNVNLEHLDMSDLHIKTDKQLRDAARVWKKMNLDDVTVYLDGDATTGEFEISQKTIEVINTINASIAGGTKSFKVKPCQVAGEVCNTIVVTGGGNLQDIAFIEDNAGNKVDVVFNAGETWKWNVNATTKVGSVKVQAAAVTRFYNKGTFVSDADATLKTFEKNGTTQNNINFRNEGIWNVTAGKLFVQFNVYNNKTGVLNISAGAEYRQDGAGHTFTNQATDVPSRFGGDNGKIATVNNSGVFATVNGGTINNYGLIEHVTENAKTYITANQLGGNFNTAFGAANKMGRINLKYSNKDEDNISISAAADQGFVSVTIDGEVSGTLNATAVGTYVNYIIVNDGVTEIAALPAQIKYVEIDDENDTEIAWNLSAPANASYLGLMVLSPVNIKLGTTIQIWDGTTPGTGACYLGADMYVGGTFNNGTAGTLPSWNGYYGNTTTNFATKYVTY